MVIMDCSAFWPKDMSQVPVHHTVDKYEISGTQLCHAVSLPNQFFNIYIDYSCFPRLSPRRIRSTLSSGNYAIFQQKKLSCYYFVFPGTRK